MPQRPLSSYGSRRQASLDAALTPRVSPRVSPRGQVMCQADAVMQNPIVHGSLGKQP